MLTNDRIEELRDDIKSQIKQLDDKSLMHHYMNQLSLALQTKAAMVPIRFPSLTSKISIMQKLEAIQSYIESLSYNYISEPFWVIKKKYSVNRLNRLAQEMISEGLPIKCLEAVVLGIYLTNGLDLDRVTMSFKSHCEDKIYRHIVLVIRLGDKWGALGLSRRPDLMGKSFTYRSLSSLVEDYKESYTKNYHTLLKVKIGLPVTHNKVSNELITWKNAKFNIQEDPWMMISKEIDLYARGIKNFR